MSTERRHSARKLLMTLIGMGALLGLVLIGAAPATAADVNSAPLGSLQSAEGSYEVDFDSTGQMYVSSAVAGSVTVYQAGWPATPGTVVKTLTGLQGVTGLALDAADNLYVAKGGAEIQMFAQGWADGATAPTKVLSGPNTALFAAWDIDFDGQGRMYVAQAVFFQAGAITVYPADWINAEATQVNIPPVNALYGDQTMLVTPLAIAVDGPGNVYATNLFSPEVVFFAHDWADPNTAPTKILAGDKTGLLSAGGVALDAAGNLYVSGLFVNSVSVFPATWTSIDTTPVNIAPAAVLTGDKTQLAGPFRIALPPSGLLYVPNINDDTVTAYPLLSPVITAVSPSSGPAAGGTHVTITGGGFVDGTTATVGGVECGGITSTSSTSLTCTTGAHAAGAADVTVTTPDTQTATRAGAFTFVPAPTVTGISPASGPAAGGTAVSISGTGFTSGATATVGGAPCNNAIVVNAGSLTCATGAHAAGKSTVVVTNTDTQFGSLTDGYEYLPAPRITSVAPDAGPLTGATPITLTGSGFLPGATVTIGGSPCSSLAVSSPSRITCRTPGHAAGPADVVVTTGGGQVTKTGGFTFVAAPGIPPRPTATAGDRRATVFVTPPANGGPVRSYTIRANHAGKSCLITASAHSCSLTGLTNGVSYRFTATAANAGGISAPSAQSSPVTPTAPCALTVSALPATTVIPANGTTTLVGFATTSPGCRLQVFASNNIRGDLRPATYSVDRSTGRVTVTTHGISGARLNVAIAGVPTGPAYHPSATWTRHWTTG